MEKCTTGGHGSPAGAAGRAAVRAPRRFDGHGVYPDTGLVRRENHPEQAHRQPGRHRRHERGPAGAWSWTCACRGS
ncbi:MAG: hypothetical protein MZV70_29770 [Desulfobacterales bacterium]|nr:hypothetical protein [Desulfobacterales bacterium]